MRTERTKVFVIAFGFVALCVLSLWILWAIIFGFGANGFESLGVLFSGFAFLAIVLTLVMQKNELVKAEEATQESLNHLSEQVSVQKQMVEVLATDAALAHTKSTIRYLNRHLATEDDGGKPLDKGEIEKRRKVLEAEGGSVESATKEVLELKRRLEPLAAKMLHTIDVLDQQSVESGQPAE